MDGMGKNNSHGWEKRENPYLIKPNSSVSQICVRVKEGTHTSNGPRDVDENGQMDPNDSQEVNRGVLHDPTEQTGSPEHLHGFTGTHRDHQERDYV